ncbi:MAG: hypothetical protein BroJett042_10660 [Bacteroidota bacterium]|nr:MAG: hypothetical protein BroJett042_10660 [Bacteroidota bacterium]
MRLLIILTIGTLISCGTKNQDHTSVGDKTDKLIFEKYVKTLKQIDIPVELTSSLSTDGNVYEYGEFRKFKTIWSDKPFGKLFTIGGKTVTVDLQIASSYGLALVIYDNVGHKLDSLYPLKKTDSDIDFETTEEVFIDKDKRIIVTSLTEKWQLSADSSSRLENTKTISRDTVTYIIGDNGQFKKIKD